MEFKGPPTWLLVAACSILMLNNYTSQAATPAAVPAVQEKQQDRTLAVIVPGGGTYSRPISTDSEQTQMFFDQGLRFAWGFFFPESIASYQQASLSDPSHPMPYWGMAHAMGPNPNSRYGRMPDDPKGEGLKAITKAKQLIGRASPIEAQLINALFVLYDKLPMTMTETGHTLLLCEQLIVNILMIPMLLRFMRQPICRLHVGTTGTLKASHWMKPRR